MQVDPTLENELRNHFSSRQVRMPERNVKQATLIPSARVLPNPVGTAPGWWVEKDNHIIVAMPGVPREMYRMWEQEAIPRLKPYTGGLIFTRILRVSGLGESAVEEQLDSLLHSNNPTIATYAKSDAIDVRITAKADTSAEAEKQVSEMEVQVRQILGHHVFGTNKETLQSVVGSLLQARNQSLAVMESLTGGLLSSTITDVPSSSKHFIGGVVAYSIKVKEQMGVPHDTIERYGAVSEETARAMAHAIREYFGAVFGVGITGVAGPDKQEGKAAGTIHIAIEGPEGVVTGMGPGWRGGRADNKRFAILSTLNLLRLHLEGVKKGE
ncbi:MAG TPA: competence/damage-inducible protein A [Ktedonobacter sp.]|nr:competence/damage-inducible protein A [Ktedonobacter sp.]